MSAKLTSVAADPDAALAALLAWDAAVASWRAYVLYGRPEARDSYRTFDRILPLHLGGLLGSPATVAGSPSGHLGMSAL